MDASLIIPQDLIAEMLDHVRKCSPMEACGLIGGNEGKAKSVFMVSNELDSSNAYRMKPEEQLSVMLWISA